VLTRLALSLTSLQGVASAAGISASSVAFGEDSISDDASASFQVKTSASKNAVQVATTSAIAEVAGLRNVTAIVHESGRRRLGTASRTLNVVVKSGTLASKADVYNFAGIIDAVLPSPEFRTSFQGKVGDATAVIAAAGVKTKIKNRIQTALSDGTLLKELAGRGVHEFGGLDEASRDMIGRQSSVRDEEKKE